MGWSQILGGIVALGETAGLIIIIEIFLHIVAWPFALLYSLIVFEILMIILSAIYLRYKLPVVVPMDRLYFLDHEPIRRLAPEKLKKIAPFFVLMIFCIFSPILLPIDIYQSQEISVIGVTAIVSLQDQMEVEL